MIEKRRKLFIFRNLLMPYNSPWHEHLQSANLYYNYKVRMRARRKFSGFFLFVSEIICIFADEAGRTRSTKEAIMKKLLTLVTMMTSSNPSDEVFPVVVVAHISNRIDAQML